MDEDQFRVQGFSASAVATGLKKDHFPDLALIFSAKQATVAGVFTTNKVKAAPVLLSRERTNKGKARAVIANSGSANACTGKKGLKDARRTAELVAHQLEIPPEEVLVASTGVIGKPIDMDLIGEGISRLVDQLAPDGFPLTARAIMTTDSFPKICGYQGQADGHPYRIVGIAKGAGMIMPDMATMLCFAVSDVAIDKQDLHQALSASVNSSLNRISVDGDTSTNDTVLVLANGLAGNNPLSDKSLDDFKKGLSEVMQELALMIIRDGEGATKVCHIEVRSARSNSDALIAARTVANSPLVKTAFYGGDPNWGRIMAALGRAEIVMQEGMVDIWVDDVQIVTGGIGNGEEAEKAAALKMTNNNFTLVIDLHQGKGQDMITTCDLGPEYISINADYKT